VDPTAGVAAVLGMQLVPTNDDTHKRLFGMLEREVYKGLESAPTEGNPNPSL
jgi:hypothetical protein